MHTVIATPAGIGCQQCHRLMAEVHRERRLREAAELRVRTLEGMLRECDTARLVQKMCDSAKGGR